MWSPCSRSPASSAAPPRPRRSADRTIPRRIDDARPPKRARRRSRGALMSGDPVVDTETMQRRVADALAAIRARTALAPAVALTLGSGLGRAADRLEDAVAIPTAELPHWPRSTVAGHAGRLTLGRWRGVPVVA